LEMKDTTEVNLKEFIAQEEKAIQDFEGMAKATAEQVEALTKAVGEKTERAGNMAVELVNMKEDLHDTTPSFAEEKAFLANLEKNCATKVCQACRCCSFRQAVRR